MSSPLVTIVTPSLNQGSFIRATIESVLKQDYESVEYVIMDGGSTDETAAVVKDYASRVTFISEPDSGQSNAINKGFKRAKGEIVAWLNSDDLFLPGAIKRGAAELQDRPAAGAVYGEGYLIDRAGNVTSRFPFTEAPNLWKLVHLSDYILQQTVFFRKSTFDVIGPIDESLHYVMDWDLLIRIGKRFELGYIPEYMACLREYPEAKSFSGGARRVAEIRRIMREHTGMRYPPGYLVYGLDTYRTIWKEAIESRTPAMLRRPSRGLQTLIDRGCLWIIGRQILHSQGLYGDGWAGKRVKLMVPAAVRQITLRGTNPCGPSDASTLQIIAGGRVLTNQIIGHGDFCFTVRLESAGEAHKIDLLARNCSPKPQGASSAPCYYRLLGVSFDGSEARTNEIVGAEVAHSGHV